MTKAARARDIAASSQLCRNSANKGLRRTDVARAAGVNRRRAESASQGEGVATATLYTARRGAALCCMGRWPRRMRLLRRGVVHPQVFDELAMLTPMRQPSECERHTANRPLAVALLLCCGVGAARRRGLRAALLELRIGHSSGLACFGCALGWGPACTNSQGRRPPHLDACVRGVDGH